MSYHRNLKHCHQLTGFDPPDSAAQYLFRFDVHQWLVVNSRNYASLKIRATKMSDMLQLVVNFRNIQAVMYPQRRMFRVFHPDDKQDPRLAFPLKTSLS